MGGSLTVIPPEGESPFSGVAGLPVLRRELKRPRSRGRWLAISLMRVYKSAVTSVAQALATASLASVPGKVA